MKNLSPIQMVIIAIGTTVTFVLLFILTGFISFTTPIINGGNGPIIKSPTKASQLANPASVNCVKQGGTLRIEKIGNASEFGLCTFEDTMACEEWALMRGECPVGGIKTTGYDNREQMYCAWLGGQTLAQENASCTLPSGNVCTDKALYNGTCQ